MPYVKKDKRVKLDNGKTPDNAGDLNYLFTKIIDEYLKKEGLSYQKMNDIVGALEGAKLEFYRKVVVPYEDKKITENGDVYTIDQNQK